MTTSTISIIYLGIDIVWLYHEIYYILRYVFIYIMLHYPQGIKLVPALLPPVQGLLSHLYKIG